MLVIGADCTWYMYSPSPITSISVVAFLSMSRVKLCGVLLLSSMLLKVNYLLLSLLHLGRFGLQDSICIIIPISVALIVVSLARLLCLLFTPLLLTILLLQKVINHGSTVVIYLYTTITITVAPSLLFLLVIIRTIGSNVLDRTADTTPAPTFDENASALVLVAAAGEVAHGIAYVARGVREIDLGKVNLSRGQARSVFHLAALRQTVFGASALVAVLASPAASSCG